MLEKERHQDVDLTNWNVNGEQKHIQNTMDVPLRKGEKNELFERI